MSVQHRISENVVKTIRKFAEEYRMDEIYLFGSYARGKATEDSDHDLLVYGK